MRNRFYHMSKELVQGQIQSSLNNFQELLSQELETIFDNDRFSIQEESIIFPPHVIALLRLIKEAKNIEKMIDEDVFSLQKKD